MAAGQGWSGAAVAVIGAGSMGAGIAQVAAQAGHKVRLFDVQSGAAAKAVERMAADLAGAVERGKLSADARAQTLARISVADTLEGLAGCALAIEAVVERLDVKRALFAELESVLGPDAVLCSNTSSLSITAIAQGLQRPQRVIGWHFFNPAQRMKLVEIIAGLDTDPALIQALRDLSAAWGKTAVLAPNAPGFIVNRVARPLYGEGLRLLAEGAAPAAAIDRLLREAGGFAMGPFELIDLIGVDVNLAVSEAVFAATQWDSRYAPHLIQQELVRAGHFGRKSGRGFYDYAAAGARPPVALVEPAATPAVLRCAQDTGLLAPLVSRLRAAGVEVLEDVKLPAEHLSVNGTAVTLGDGRTALERSGGAALILLDLALDFGRAPLFGASASPAGQAELPALAAALSRGAAGLLALKDVAGGVVLRCVACLANEAADVVTWGGASAADIDDAMRLGTAYPLGPLAWADALGPSRVVRVLENLHAHYGDNRYRRSPRLLRAHHGQGTLHEHSD